MLEEGALRAGGEQRHALLGVARVFEHLGRVPVVQHLVVVPEHHLRDLGVEAPHVLVEQVVEVVAAELLERLGHLRLGRGDEVAPDRAVVERHLRRERVVGVDRVAAVDEHVGLEPPHRLVAAHAAAREVDAPALADRVRGPGEPHVARGGSRGCTAPRAASAAERCGSARGRQAPGPQVGEVLEQHPVDDRLVRRQARQVDAGREARLGKRRRADHAARVRERLARRPLDDHPRRPVGAAPDDRAVAGHVAGHGAVRHRRARRVVRDQAGRAARHEQRSRRRAREPRDERPPRRHLRPHGGAHRRRAYSSLRRTRPLRLDCWGRWPMRVRALTVLVILALSGYCATVAGAQDTALDQKVRSFLESRRGTWRDLNVPWQDGQLLHDLIVKHRFKRALEIGTSTGHSAIWIAWGLSKTGGKLVTLEIDPGAPRRGAQELRGGRRRPVRRRAPRRRARARASSSPGPSTSSSPTPTRTGTRSTSRTWSPSSRRAAASRPTTSRGAAAARGRVPGLREGRCRTTRRPSKAAAKASRSAANASGG